MALAIATVADSISKLSVTGLTIEDVDDMSVSIPTQNPTLAPRADDYISNMELIYDSQGSGDVAQMTFRYDLNYRLYYKPVGSGIELEAFDGLVDMIALILDAVIGIVNLTGAVETIPTGTIRPGIVVAPDGTLHWGCDLSFRVMEFIN